MNLLQLKTLVVSYLDDRSYGYFTEDQVTVFLNNAQKEVQKKLIKMGDNYYTRFVQTNTVPNQSRYVLPQDFKKLHRLEMMTSGTVPNESVQSLTPMTINQQDLISRGTGQPLYYFIEKNQLVLFPTPDSSQTLRLVYSYQVTDMSLDSDTPDIPDSYHEFLALLAAQDGFLKDGRANELLMKKIAEYESDFNADAEDRQQDTVREIVNTGSDVSSWGGVFWALLCVINYFIAMQ